MGTNGWMGGALHKSPSGSKTFPDKGYEGGVAVGKIGVETVDLASLENIPEWLRCLRLQRCARNFEGMNWRDMVTLDEAQLEAKGVAALGARRKMLKTFEVVRKKMNIEFPADGTTTTANTSA